MRQPEKNPDNERSPPDRQFDVMLHSAGDFSHKRWPARVSNRNSLGACLKNGSRRGNEADGCARLPGNPPRYLGGYGAWGFCRHAPRRNMKLIPSFAILAALAALGVSSPNLQAAEEDGVALAILYDTSGSMKEAVPHKDGKPAP